MPLNLAILYGSVRETRQGIKAARFVDDQLQRRGHRTTLVDPLEYRLPLLDRMYKEYPKGEAPDVLERLATLYRAADGFVVVSGEYNHGIPPALKNLLDTSWRSTSGARRRSSATPAARSAACARPCSCG